MSTQNINLITFFHRLPTEIIFMIFNYLSSNDIIYTFFHLSQRLNYLLLENKRYLNYLELPTTNFDFWKDILLIIGSKIESLNIKTIDLSFPLKYFKNLKLLIISSPHGFQDDQLELILESDKFQNLNLFKIKQNLTHDWKIFGDQLIIGKHLIEKVFNHKNSLETFEYPFRISLDYLSVDNFETNANLRSLTMVLWNLGYISRVIQFTPNLEYLNVQSALPYTNERIINEININLKEFHLTETARFSDTDFDIFFSYIKQFSSSLSCLSLNLLGPPLSEIPFNSLKLQLFLESMIQLQQFHLHARFFQRESDNENILLEFTNKFWFDHNWFFGMHGDYLYTLPFHFDYLYEFYDGFDGVKSSHPELLETDPRLWYNVKSIDLRMTSENDLNLIKQLKIKMPKLKFIKFDAKYFFIESNEAEDISTKKNEKETSYVTLNNVTTVGCRIGPEKNRKEWLTHVLPNLTHLILPQSYFPSIDDELTEILNKKIQRLDITEYIVQLSSKDISIYFSNLQHIFLDFSKPPRDRKKSDDGYCKYTVMGMLSNLEHLKTLLIHCDEKFLLEIDSLIRHGNKDNKSCNVKEIMKTYHMKHFDDEYCLFTKKLF